MFLNQELPNENSKIISFKKMSIVLDPNYFDSLQGISSGYVVIVKSCNIYLGTQIAVW